MASAEVSSGPLGGGALSGLSSALNAVGASRDAAEQDTEPLRRPSPSQANRSRVQEHQRFLATQLLQYSLPLVTLVAVMLVLLFVTSAVIYVQGWMVMSKFSEKPCDEPLKWWLLIMLLVPIMQCQLNSQTPPDQRPKRFQALVTPIAIGAGAWMVCHSKTCNQTAPELYGYAKMYLICQSAVWVLSFAVSCGFVSLVFWMHRNGLLETGPGPAFAARPGLINDIETVAFCPSDFPDRKEDDDAQPPECAICVEAFVEGAMLKKTPCGHFFCEECLGNWLANYAKTCPLCREDLQQALDDGGGGPGDQL